MVIPITLHSLPTHSGDGIPTPIQLAIIWQQFAIDALWKWPTSLTSYSNSLEGAAFMFNHPPHLHPGKLDTWTVEDVTHLRRDTIEGGTRCIDSLPIYTETGGYKVGLRLYPYGDFTGRGTHLSVSFIIHKGDYDSFLPWPFRQKVAITLLGRPDEMRHVVREITPDPAVHGACVDRPSAAMNAEIAQLSLLSSRESEGGSD